jgi:hypothetical protein
LPQDSCKAEVEDGPDGSALRIDCGGALSSLDGLDKVLPKFGAALAPGSFLPVIDGDAPVDPPWEPEETAWMTHFFVKVDGKRPFGWRDASKWLEQLKQPHRLFQRVGFRITAPFEVSQTILKYLRGQHSRATWSEDHLGEQDSAEFDSGMTALLGAYAIGGTLKFSVQTCIEWGLIIE